MNTNSNSNTNNNNSGGVSGNQPSSTIQGANDLSGQDHDAKSSSCNIIRYHHFQPPNVQSDELESIQLDPKSVVSLFSILF